MKIILLVVVIFATSGCASLLKTMTDDPVRATPISDKDRNVVVSTISLDASRRNVVVSMHGDNIGHFCAEPPPDAANAIESTLKAAIEADIEKKGSGSLSLEDIYKSSIVQLAKRTELIDIYRTATYSLCQLHLNGAIDPDTARDIFKQMTLRALEKAESAP